MVEFDSCLWFLLITFRYVFTRARARNLKWVLIMGNYTGRVTKSERVLTSFDGQFILYVHCTCLVFKLWDIYDSVESHN